uniref:Mucolipin extracytosolic domain-containing protein n=1 Tax=Ditylenchus dipsaci TaxID=166011 RepID=A0A915EFI0_9BILA
MKKALPRAGTQDFERLTILPSDPFIEDCLLVNYTFAACWLGSGLTSRMADLNYLKIGKFPNANTGKLATGTDFYCNIEDISSEEIAKEEYNINNSFNPEVIQNWPETDPFTFTSEQENCLNAKEKEEQDMAHRGTGYPYMNRQAMHERNGDSSLGPGVTFADRLDDIFCNYNETLEHLQSHEREIGQRLLVFITIQLVLHKFLKNWNDERDAVVYPPDSSKYAVFTSDQILEHFAFIVKSYYSLQTDSFASFSYDSTQAHPLDNPAVLVIHWKTNMSLLGNIPPIRLCINRIADVNIQNETYIFDISEVNEYLLSIREIFLKRNITFKPEDALTISRASIKFNLRTIHFSPLSNDQKPECYLIKITIDFDNTRHTGQVFVRLYSIISYDWTPFSLE